MTSIASIRNRIKALQPAGRIIVCFEGEPVPPHTDRDTIVLLDAEDRDIL